MLNIGALDELFIIPTPSKLSAVLNVYWGAPALNCKVCAVALPSTVVDGEALNVATPFGTTWGDQFVAALKDASVEPFPTQKAS